MIAPVMNVDAYLLPTWGSYWLGEEAVWAVGFKTIMRPLLEGRHACVRTNLLMT